MKNIYVDDGWGKERGREKNRARIGNRLMSFMSEKSFCFRTLRRYIGRVLEFQNTK